MDDKKRKVLGATCLALLEMLDDDEEEDAAMEEAVCDLYEDAMLAIICREESTASSPTRREFPIIPAYSDDEFESLLKMSRSTYKFIFELIEPRLMSVMPRYKRNLVEKQFFITIWKMVTADTYGSLCQKFSVTRATIAVAVRVITETIASLGEQFIIWPEGGRALEVMANFAESSGFPNVLGAVGSCHIAIRVPKMESEVYKNDEGQHSIHLQAVCDNSARFTHFSAGFVGSIHKQSVLRSSELQNFLNDPSKFPNDSHLVADASYTLQSHLMVPYEETESLPAWKVNYNSCHETARVAIEHAFGLLKARFRSLSGVLDMTRIDRIPTYLVACCTIHNICLLRNDYLSSLEIMVNVNNIPEFPICFSVESYEKRERICKSLEM